MMPGFPSYCTGSLLMITSSNTCCRCSCIGHHVFLHTRPDNRPNQVHLRYVPSTSYRFLQTPPLAGDALASRIQFPMNRAWSLSSSDWVCQLRWAKQTSPLGEVSVNPLCGDVAGQFTSIGVFGSVNPLRPPGPLPMSLAQESRRQARQK